VHSARRVVHMESYIGLVEVGVGLVPGAGGLTYIARRAAENAGQSTDKDLLPFLTEGFTAAAMAKVGTSALESRKLGYLLDSDVIVPHKDELLFVAINEAKAMLPAATAPRTSACSRWPGAAARPPSWAAGQHARRRLHQPARLPHRQPDCRW
jgi:enoyl-CoA hydratase/carnithine racemase